MLSRAGTSTRALWVRADELPAKSQVKLWRAPIDYTDSSSSSPDRIPNDGGVLIGGSPIASSRFDGGPMSVTVDTSTSCFFWAEVLDSTGRVIAFSNMIYQLRKSPPEGRRLSLGIGSSGSRRGGRTSLRPAGDTNVGSLCLKCDVKPGG